MPNPIIKSVPSGITFSSGQIINFYIDENDLPNSVYKWYLVSNSGATITLIGTNNNCVVTVNDVGDFSVYVELYQYNESWTNGHFYGGNFQGYFGGGKFHYGTLNGVDYNKPEIKNNNFIQ